VTADEIAAGLTPLLERVSGARSVRLDDVRTMTGGAAREAWSCEAALEWPDGRRESKRLVVLVFRPAGPNRAFSAREEFRLLQAARAAGVPVAPPLFAGEEGLGRPFYVMERVDGETIGRRLVRDDRFAGARRVLPAQLGAALAAIHRVPIDRADLDFLPRPAGGSSVAAGEITRIEELYRLAAVEPHAVFEIAFRWLRERCPASERVTLVHGDFRIGNVIVDAESGLRAVLDWELAHLGDPIEDLGWACVRSWRFGRDDLTCGGVGTREDLVAGYERAGGAVVDREALRFWEIFGNLRWGVFTLLQLRGFLDGTVPNVELAAIGRRTAETEWEILNLLEGSV
jgi:aminoglycoside phosphotransferase (APT) family kinase protein